jgi:hypothetical protein
MILKSVELGELKPMKLMSQQWSNMCILPWYESHILLPIAWWKEESWTGEVAKVVEHLPSKQEDQSHTLGPKKKQKEE